MSDRQQQILRIFQNSDRFGVTTSDIAMLTGTPEASIRRDIQSLRNDGYNISFASPNGVYRFGTQ